MQFGTAKVLGASGGNFLIPNGTFIFELAIFLVVLGIVAKFILPPIQKVMDERETTIRSAQQASDEGHAEAARLVAERRSVLEAARLEARATLERAANDANLLIDDARVRGQQEHERLTQAAQPGLRAERDQLREDSIARLGDLVVKAASSVIGDAIDPGTHRGLIDQMISAAKTESEG